MTKGPFSRGFIKLVWGLFKQGLDTLAIARELEMAESTIYNALAARNQGEGVL